MIFLFLLEKKPFSHKNIQSYEHHSKNNSRKSSQSKGKTKKLLASPTKHANFSPYRRFHRPCSSLNIDGKSSGFIKTEKGETLSPKNENQLSMSPVLCKIPRKKNTQNLRGKGIINLQPLEEDEKIYSGFKNFKKNENKENEDIDLKRVDELTTVRKRKDNLNVGEESPLKPAFKQSKRLGGKALKSSRKEKNEGNNIEFIDNEDEDEEKENKDDEEDDDKDKDSSNDSSFEDVDDIEKEDEGF